MTIDPGRKKIAQFGTFEVQNYGDLLFPLILKHELAARLAVEVELFSPTASLPEVQSLFSNAWHSADALVIGGGDIISLAPNIYRGYKRTWSYPIHPHAACWALPSMQRPVEVPVLWNAPGVPFPFTKQEAVLVRAIALQASYLSVRDAISKRHLQEAGVTADIAVVPDTVLLLPKYWTREALRPVAAALLKRCGLAIGEPLVFQMHPRPRHEIAEIVRLLKSLGKPILLLPTSYSHKDHEFLAKIGKQGPFHLLAEPLEIQQTAALIAHANCFVGTSLHGAITAFAYGIPYLTYNLIRLNKLDGFAQLTEEPGRLLKHLHGLHESKEWLTRPPSRTVYKKLVAQIDAHFDTLAAAIQTPVAPSSVQTAHYLELLQEHQTLHHTSQKEQVHVWPVRACRFFLKGVRYLLYR